MSIVQTYRVKATKALSLLRGTKFAPVLYRNSGLYRAALDAVGPDGSEVSMSLVRLLGFTTLGCGCVVGRYREVATNREVSYIEEKGKTCGNHGHRRNHTIAADRPVAPIVLAARAS